jgi:hypothetical protein
VVPRWARSKKSSFGLLDRAQNNILEELIDSSRIKYNYNTKTITSYRKIERLDRALND